MIYPHFIHLSTKGTFKSNLFLLLKSNEFSVIIFVGAVNPNNPPSAAGRIQRPGPAGGLRKKTTTTTKKKEGEQ